MKKINIFNRNTNLPLYRRMPVSCGFNCNGEITLFGGMTKKICSKFLSRWGRSRAISLRNGGWPMVGGWFTALVALFIITPVFATPTVLDKKTVASKAYVDTKQNIIPGGTAGNVVTYTGNDGDVGSATVSSSATYTNNILTNGNDIANITAIETKQNKLTCAGYEPGHEGDLDYCWLYGEIDIAATCKANGETCSDDGECCGVCLITNTQLHSGVCTIQPSGPINNPKA